MLTKLLLIFHQGKPEKEVLSLGLDVALPRSRINYVEFFLPLEKLCYCLNKRNTYKHSWTYVWHSVSVLARKSFNQYCKEVHDRKDQNEIHTILT